MRKKTGEPGDMAMGDGTAKPSTAGENVRSSEEREPTDVSRLMGELIAHCDADSRILSVNQAFCDKLGGDEAGWKGRRFRIKGAAAEGSEADGFETGERRRYEAAMRCGERAAWFEWEETRLPGGEALFVGRDVTRRRRLEKALRDARAEAEAADHAKTQFLATMSHEMRTPLNGIIGMTGLLLDTNLNPNQTNYASAVRESGVGLLALINDILDFSKIEAGRIDLEDTPFRLDTAVQSVVELLSPKAFEKGIEIAAAIDPATPLRLSGDEARFRQVLLNLAGNGVKFTERGGVAIHVTPSPEPGDDGRERIRVEVRDTGVGVPDEARERIFEEFSQADSSHSRRFGGTGLGLAIVKRIVEALGGEISLESAPDVGSVFAFTFQMRAQSAAAGQPAPVATLARTAIVVTRSNLLDEALSKQLAAIGYRSHRAPTPEAARRLSDETPTAAFLCDAALARDHAEIAAGLKTSFVLLPAASRDDAERYLTLGFSGYLLKPIRQTTLERLLGEGAEPGAEAEETRLDSPEPPPHESENRLRVLLAEDN
ncbi:MAG: ATP-binding protein, partial [Pseudomonadota bacterium]